MFAGFAAEQVETGDASIFVRHAGSGPPVLLLHGHPRTSATWHRVAPRLVDALDHPQAVERLALVDCVPISEHLRRADARFATEWWHWFFFAQPDIPERVINADPVAWYGGKADPAAMGADNHAELMAAVARPEVVRAMLEDYRAGLTVDRAHEEADRAAGRRVTAPLRVLWSLQDDIEDLYGDPLVIWREWADDVDGFGIDSGHHVAEENPEDLARALAGHFRPEDTPTSSALNE